MLSFGQTAFFGLAGYSYGVIAINLGQHHGYPFLALLCALVIAAAFAALLGYFMIYGRITGVFVGIVTLSVTLTFATFMNQTAGPEWRIGRARLNGYNGMTRIPTLSIPWFDGDGSISRAPTSTISSWCCWCSAISALRMLVNSRFGNVLVAIRENPERAELLGYDIRRYQLGAFVDRQHAGGAERRALHRLGPVHRAGLDGAAGGGHADHLGRGRRPQGPDRDADRHLRSCSGCSRP